jgi:hypothetical protein
MAWSSGGRTTTISWWPVPGWLQGGDDGLLCCLLLERRSLLTDGRGDGSAWRLVEQLATSRAVQRQRRLPCIRADHLPMPCRRPLSLSQRDQSMLTWEDKQFLSGAVITEHLVGLPFGKVQHKIVTTDAQPSQPGAENLMVLVTGQLIVR